MILNKSLPNSSNAGYCRNIHRQVYKISSLSQIVYSIINSFLTKLNCLIPSTSTVKIVQCQLIFHWDQLWDREIMTLSSFHRLIQECWHENPAKRPTFRQILTRLDAIQNSIGHKRRWKVSPLNLCLGILYFTWWVTTILTLHFIWLSLKQFLRITNHFSVLNCYKCFILSAPGGISTLESSVMLFFGAMSTSFDNKYWKMILLNLWIEPSLGSYTFQVLVL